MLQTWFVPQLRERGLEATAILQQDGAPAHFALPVGEYLDDRFSGRWIGCGSDMMWLPRSPDLTTCDNSLWGIVKDKLSHLRLPTIEDLKAAIRNCFNDFQPSAWKMSRRTWKN
jgi:hypothetical protein